MPVILLIAALIALIVWHVELWAFVVGIWLVVTGIPVILFVRNHPVQSAFIAGAYLVVGGLWSIYKWYLLERAGLRRAREEFAKDSRDTATWPSFVERRKRDASTHSSTIIGWISFWPFSLVWFLLHDPVAMIYEELRGVYGRVSDFVWRHP